jgi:hypothetical protein
LDLDELAPRQRVSLWLDGHEGLYSVPDTLGFVREVSLALRDGAASDLPLASMYCATQRQVPVAEDEQVAHERVMPAIYALRRGKAEPRVSDAAREALDFIVANERATSGDIRRALKVEGQRRPDAADTAHP